MRLACLSLAFSAATGLGCTIERTFAEGSGGSGGGTSTSTGATASTTSSGGASGSGGSGGSTSTGTPCGTGTDVCVPETPSGWQGPFAFYEGPGGVGTPFCPSAYATPVGEYFADIDPGVVDCGCDCTDATGIQCTNPIHICNTSSCVNPIFCSNLNADYTLAPYPGSNCVPLNPGNMVNLGAPTPSNVGSCTASSNPVIPTPIWGTASKVCGGAATVPTGCATGEVCAPTGDAQFDKLCIAQPGDVACAGTFYSVKHLIFEDFADDRACSTCGCGTAVSICGGSVSFDYNSCTFAGSNIIAGGCGAVVSTATEATYAPSPSGTCPETGGVVSGGAVPTGDLTLCCNG